MLSVQQNLPLTERRGDGECALVQAVVELTVEFSRRDFLPPELRQPFLWGIILQSYISLRSEGDITVGDLIEAQRCPRASMNRHLNGLERQGWISRFRSPRDKRQTFIRPTEKAVDLINQWLKDRASLAERQMSEMHLNGRAMKRC